MQRLEIERSIVHVSWLLQDQKPETALPYRPISKSPLSSNWDLLRRDFFFFYLYFFSITKPFRQ
jgi:hypothetical protein